MHLLHHKLSRATQFYTSFLHPPFLYIITLTYTNSKVPLSIRTLKSNNFILNNYSFTFSIINTQLVIRIPPQDHWTSYTTCPYFL